jgi:hypothetical protein
MRSRDPRKLRTSIRRIRYVHAAVKQLRGPCGSRKMSDEDKLTSASRRYGQYKSETELADKLTKQARKEFMDAATEVAALETPARSIERVIAEDMETALRIAQRRFHNYTIVDVRRKVDDEEPSYEVILEEDPALRPFSFVNREDGKVYSRVIVEGSPYLDDEALRVDDPELWDRITEKRIVEEIKPLDSLSDDDLAAIQPYLAMPPAQARMGKIRKAKPEDYEDND